MDRKACDGGPVIDEGDMAVCAECGTAVRWDLQEHPFFGFQNCLQRSRQVETHSQSTDEGAQQ